MIIQIVYKAMIAQFCVLHIHLHTYMYKYVYMCHSEDDVVRDQSDSTTSMILKVEVLELQ